MSANGMVQPRSVPYIGQIGSGRLKIEDPLSGKRIESGIRRAELLGEQIGGIAMETLRTE